MKREYEEKVKSVETIREGLGSLGYISDEGIATAVYVATHLEKPILVEGPAGVGKTELAKATASWLGASLIRMQCYEGLDETKALYEWKYGKQLLYTQVLKDQLADILQGARGLAESVDRLHQFGDIFYSEQFLEARPLLRALNEPKGCVLLVDEIDKADQEFESFLLELLSDYQITIPEVGTIQAKTKPIVFLTSNNTREIGDALKRRCMHLYIPFPERIQEERIIAARVPELAEGLRRQLVNFVQGLRRLDLKKVPAISETIDWARALVLLHADKLDGELVRNTLNVLLKYQEDVEGVQREMTDLLNRTRTV